MPIITFHFILSSVWLLKTLINSKQVNKEVVRVRKKERKRAIERIINYRLKDILK